MKLIPPPPREYYQRPPSGYDSDRHPYVELGTQTTLNGAVTAGSTQITVNNSTGFNANDEIFIDGGATNSEINEIASDA